MVSACAFLLDMLLVSSLLIGTPLAALPAAAISFVTIAALVYLFHEFWTFSDPAAQFSFKRLGGVLGAAAVSLTTRLVLLWTLLQFAPNAPTVIELGLVAMAAAGSLCVNFILNSLIFRRGNLQELS